MKIFFLSAAVAISLASQSHAALSDPLIVGAKECTTHFARQERVRGIPSNLLAAISNTESGRWSDTLGMVLPWPWTINADGKGYYFASKAEAIRKVHELKRKGANNIDVGCMQISMKHHPNAFRSIEEAFEPRYNVAYAAKFLKGHYDDMHDWNKAIGAYHSKTPKYGNKYLARVKKSWDAILGKVRIARAAIGAGKPEAEPSPSYRVIKVRDSDSQEFASLSEPIVRRLPEKPKTVKKSPSSSQFSMSVKEDSGTSLSSGKGIALRPQDRLPKGYRRTASIVKPSTQKHSQPMVIRPTTTNDVTEDALAIAPESDGFVSFHSGAESKKPSSGIKPKFIFVE